MAAGRKTQVEATKVLTKVSHPIYILEQDVSHKMFKEIASFASDAVKKSLKALVKIRDDANLKRTSSPDAALPLVCSAAAVCDEVKQAMHNSAVVRSMIAAAESHFHGKK